MCQVTMKTKPQTFKFAIINIYSILAIFFFFRRKLQSMKVNQCWAKKAMVRKRNHFAVNNVFLEVVEY